MIESTEQFHDPQSRAKTMEVAGLLGLTTPELNQAQLAALIWAETLAK